jgi:hypothetical protein
MIVREENACASEFIRDQSAGSARLTSANIVRQAQRRSAPSFLEVMLLSFIGSLLFTGTILLFKNYGSAVENFGDSSAYESIASAIQRWTFDGLQIKQFWGYPYAITAVATLAQVSMQTSLLIVSWFSCFLSIALAYRLWGGWIAAFFAVLNFDWMQRSFLGGSEPLAVALIFGAFLAARNKRYLVAALLAALSTVVRPLGILCLVGIGIELLYQRQYKKLALSVLIGVIVGGLSVAPLALHFGDPFATVHSYREAGTSLFGYPFYAIIKGTILYPAPFTNLLLSFGWILLVIAGLVLMIKSPDFRRCAKEHRVEVLFAIPYLLLIFCYNYPVFARSNFPRFVIPALPIVFVALSRWLPRNRGVIWGLGVVMPILAASSVLGIRNVMHLLRVP